MAVILENSHVLDPETGKFVSVEHQRIATIIQEYDPDLYLAWIPPDKRSFDDTQPFAILHKQPDGRMYVVRKVKEGEVNSDLIAWLWMNDSARQGTDLTGRLEAQDAARRAVEMKRQIQKDDERRDFYKSVLRSPLNTYRHNGVKYQ